MMILILLVFPGIIFSLNYAVVVDAGSTGSRFHIYHWYDIKKIEQVELPDDIKKIKKLSAYVGNITGLKLDYGIAIDKITPMIKGVSFREVPFYLGATAGLRILPTEDAQSLIVGVQDLIREKYSFKYLDRNIRVLSGEEEGVFGWLTVQYVDGNFDFNETYGALDMGGASTQISFIPTDQQILEDKKTVKVFGTILDIYTHSFLRFGLNEAYRLSLKELIMQNVASQIIENPCLLKGYNDSKTIEGIIFRGTSDISKCEELILEVLNLNRTCFYPENTCSIDNEYVPKQGEGNFYAFSGFFYMIQGLGLDGQKNLKLSTFREKTRELCKYNYSYALNHTHLPKEYVGQQCFNNFYGLGILINGYKFKEDSDQVKFVETVNNNDVGWALGNLLFENMFAEISKGRCDPIVEKTKDFYVAPMAVGFSLFGISVIFVALLFCVILLQCFLIVGVIAYIFVFKGSIGTAKTTIYERVDGDL